MSTILKKTKLFGKGKKPKKNIAEGMEARIQHLEDLVYFEGSKGAARALEGLRSLEKGGHVDATIKWDGSPAIIFGNNEQGEFILTDKSGFTAKGYDGKPKSPEKLKAMFLDRKGGANKSDPGYVSFANNMKNIFNAYKTALPEGFEGYYKGDLLYYTPHHQMTVILSSHLTLLHTKLNKIHL